MLQRTKKYQTKNFTKEVQEVTDQPELVVLILLITFYFLLD